MRVAAVAIVLMLLWSSPAGAVIDEDGGVEPSVTIEASANDGELVAGASYNVDIGEAVNLGPDPFADCDVFANLDRSQLANLTGTQTTTDPQDQPNQPDQTAGVDPTSYVLIYCNAGLIRFWEQTEPVPGDVLNILTTSARNRTPITTPTPSFSPAGTPDAPLLTQLPTWLWLTDNIWAQATATASIDEPGITITVTVTATPTTLAWNPGDDSPPITCGQGTPWQPGADERPPPQDACTHTYTRTAGTSGTPPLTTTTTLNYDIVATCTPAALCTNLTQPGDIDITTTTNITITQIRGVITG